MVEYLPSKVFQGLSGGDGAPFYDRVEAAQFPETILRFRNQRWAEAVGLGGLNDDQWLGHFGRFRPLPNNMPNTSGFALSRSSVSHL